MSNRRRLSTPFNVRISLSGLLLLALHCTPSVAQDTVPDTSEESTIVVEGSRDLDNAREEAERLAREQASEITRAARRGLPLERHHLPVCPFVNGMNDAVSEFIVRRMKSNAASIGVEAGGADCSKNIFVGLVSDVEMEVAALLKDEAWAFGELRRYQIDRITSETGPSRAWHVSIIGDRFGSPKERSTGSAARTHQSVRQPYSPSDNPAYIWSSCPHRKSRGYRKNPSADCGFCNISCFSPG